MIYYKYTIYYGNKNKNIISCTDLEMAKVVAKSVNSTCIERREYIKLD